MNFKLIIFFLLSSFSILILSKTENNSQIKVIDATLATAYNPEGNIVVLMSDLKPSLDGKPRTLKDILFEELGLRDAKKLHIDVTDQDVDRYLTMLQKQTGYSLRQIENSFKELGYTIEEGREQLKRTNILQDVVSYRVRSQNQVLVTEEAIQDYHEKNPVKIEESYKIAQAFLEYNKSKSEEENIQIIEKLISDGNIQYAAPWDEAVEFKVSELSQEQAFIKDMKADQVSIFRKTPDGLYLVRLVEKNPEKTMSLEERRQEIETILKAKVYQDKMAEYEKMLFETSKIRYHNIVVPDLKPSK